MTGSAFPLPPPGVSVAICTYNGASRLPATLEHLRAQVVSPEIPWEVIVIDNASTDDSAGVARRCWPEDSPTQLRIIREPKLGLSNARVRAFCEARHEIVSFIDDDNWVSQDWVEIVSSVMRENPDVGALGSLVYPVCEVNPPQWFEAFRHRYATLTAADFAKIDKLVILHGAGLSVRKAAWEELIAKGFRFSVPGRIGKKLSGCEDTELTCALKLADWRLYIEPRLSMRHFLSANRLTWKYLRRLSREGGAAELDAYFFVHQTGDSGLVDHLSQFWFWHFLLAGASIVRRPAAVLGLILGREGDRAILDAEGLYGRMVNLLRLRSGYARKRREVREASWRRRETLG